MSIYSYINITHLNQICPKSHLSQLFHSLCESLIFYEFIRGQHP